MPFGDYSDYKKRMVMMSNSRVHGNTRKYLEHAKREQKVLDAYHTRHASLEFRKKALQHQKKSNYQLEYDRIRGELTKSVLPSHTVEHLKEREKHLKELGAKAINNLD